MTIDIKLHRQRAAEAARAYLAKTLPWKKFIEEFGDSKDELVGNLVDLIEHEPKRGGFLGTNEKEWVQYQSQVASAIAALESQQ